METKSIAIDLAYQFAIDILQLTKKLKTNREFVLSKQLLKSGTSIGANLVESKGAQSRSDFIAKIHISLKEAHESRYWINLLTDSKLIDQKEGSRLRNQCSQIIAILTATLKTSKSRL
jgi:four helix bundle protein